MKNLRAVKICVFIVAVFCSSLPFSRTDYCAVRADEAGTFLRVISADTPFFLSETAEKPLFFLPYTYYVKAIERVGDLTRVEYGAVGRTIDGYVPTEKLFDDGLRVNQPFPEITVTTAENCVLYADFDLSVSLQFVFKDRNMYYYGEYFDSQGERIYYIGYNNRLGYVKETSLVPFTVPYHPNELTFLEEENPKPAEEQSSAANENSLFNLRVIIISLLSLAGITALFVAFGKKPKTNVAAGYYDENDYE